MTTFQALGILFFGSAITSVIFGLQMQIMKTEPGRDNFIFLAVAFGIIGAFCMALSAYVI